MTNPTLNPRFLAKTLAAQEALSEATRMDRGAGIEATFLMLDMLDMLDAMDREDSEQKT